MLPYHYPWHRISLPAVQSERTSGWGVRSWSPVQRRWWKRPDSRRGRAVDHLEGCWRAEKARSTRFRHGGGRTYLGLLSSVPTRRDEFGTFENMFGSKFGGRRCAPIASTRMAPCPPTSRGAGIHARIARFFTIGRAFLRTSRFAVQNPAVMTSRD